MLETLALHVASAISNSRAYARLHLAQEQLVEREKMAALGSLVAGVAHELNTPLGNALLLTSTLNERARELPESLASIDKPMQAFWEFRQLVRQAGELIESSLRSAATLVSSFKQVAADQTTDRRRSFELGQVVGELMATLHNQLQPHRHQLVLDIPAGILMDSYPGSLNQVLTNLTINALQHGLDGRNNGRIAIRAARQENEVTIEFSDNGGGISDAHLRRVFEPFFTTRLGSGGTGLGLSISYNIVTLLLGGSLQVSSPAGSGATFKLRIPLTAPMRKAGPASSEPS
jgi:signal transduction histidine kinase